MIPRALAKEVRETKCLHYELHTKCSYSCIKLCYTDTCEVTYSGTLRDGTPFDAGTTSFAPNQVIRGWTEAMQLMSEGDKWRLHIPYPLAYGER